MSLFSFLFGTKKSDSITVLSIDEFKSHIQNKKVQLVDVRTPNEFRQGHIKKAINIDFFSGKFNVDFNKLNKEKPIYLYCRSGARSRQTANKLAKNGFEEIYDLKSGYLKW